MAIKSWAKETTYWFVLLVIAWFFLRQIKLGETFTSDVHTIVQQTGVAEGLKSAFRNIN